jgi:class 3 adenylate cyclase
MAISPCSFNIVKTVKSTAVKYDPRLRLWYEGAKKSKFLYWTDVYIFFHDGKAGITAAYPAIAANGKFVSVFGLDIHLEEISHFLENLKIGKNGVAFIFNEKNELVAYPDVSRTIKEENGILRPVLIKEMGIASITASFRECQQQGKNKCVIETGGKRYVASFQNFPESFRARWKVGVVVPEDDFIGSAKDEMRVSLIICAIILAISISLAMLISRGISRPIRLLTQETDKTIAEGMAPEELMLHLSEYFDELTQILTDQHGTVDKYIGDGIMAFWGAPVPDDNHALRACNAALICQAKLKDLNHKWAEAGKSPLATRIGISTGETVVGNVGSSERINYTVMGDNVNLASRLEGVNKLYETQIIVSRGTYEAVSDKFWFRPLDIVAVKGKSEGTAIYELLMKKGEVVRNRTAALCLEFARGFETYLARDWERAIEIFKNLSIKFPNDSPTKLYLTRCLQYQATPPQADWRGIAYLETK